MSNPTHYRSGEFLSIFPPLFALLLVVLRFCLASDPWKPFVIIVCSWLAIFAFLWGAIRQRGLRNQSLLVLQGFMLSRQRQIAQFVLLSVLYVGAIGQLIQSFCSHPFDVWLFSKASINCVTAVGMSVTWWTDLQQSLITASTIYSPTFFQPVRWTQIEGYTWQEKEVKEKKYLSLILYIQNWWKLPFFEHLKLKVIVQPDEKETVEELLHRKYVGKMPTL